MTQFAPIKPPKRPRIGLYSVGHAHYWNQFEGLLERLLGYNRFIAQRMSALGDVCNVGMIDGEGGARRAAETTERGECRSDFLPRGDLRHECVAYPDCSGTASVPWSY